MIRGSKTFWDPFACFHWTFCSFSDKSNNSAKEKSHIYLSEQFSCSNSKHYTYYSYNLPKSGKFYQKKKATGHSTWVSALPLENWTSASTVVIEDGKGALQKNTEDRDSRILSDCSGFQQRTSFRSKNCWQSLGSCSAICHWPECKLQHAGRKPSSLCLTVFQHIVTSCKSLGDRTASTCKKSLSDPKHFADKAALLPPGSSGRRQQELMLGPKQVRTCEKSTDQMKASHQTSSPPTCTWPNKLLAVP